MKKFINILNVKKIKEGKYNSNFYLDEGLMKKLETLWEEPSEEEVDIIYKVKRKM